MAIYESGRAFAEAQDRFDSLAHLREHFYTKENQIYMDGNSLGLCSKDAEKAVLRALEDWKTYGINLWTGAPTNYFLYHDAIGAKLARLINARSRGGHHLCQHHAERPSVCCHLLQARGQTH